MSDSFDSFSNLEGKGGDKELQDFLMVEKQKAQFNAQVISTSFSLMQLLSFFIFRYMNLATFVGTNAWTSHQVNWIVKLKHA